MNPYSRLSSAILKSQPATAARVLENYPAETVARYLAAASLETAGLVVGHFTPGYAASCLAALEPAPAGRILGGLLPESQITLLRQLDHDKRESLLGEMQPDIAASIQRLLPWPDGTAGALMEAPLASVPEDLSVRHALKRIKRIRRGMKFYLYATNSRGQLAGVVTLHELLNSLPSSTIGQVMDRRVASLPPTLSIQAVLDSPYWQEYHAMPVTDGNNILLGVIRQKSLRRLEEQLRQTGAISSGLGTVMAVGELFSVTAVQLLSALISTGRSLAERDPRV
ncbi:MAG TPA: CBS domain-containing protein [Gammaproteobacteria bacterium]|nr:CBS domain-containing protein [Gammaproteobacteria bacterium]